METVLFSTLFSAATLDLEFTFVLSEGKKQETKVVSKSMYYTGLSARNGKLLRSLEKLIGGRVLVLLRAPWDLAPLEQSEPRLLGEGAASAWNVLPPVT